MKTKFIVENRFGARRRIVWTTLDGRAIEGETGFHGQGVLMTPTESAEFRVMLAEGRKVSYLSDKVLSIEKS